VPRGVVVGATKRGAWSLVGGPENSIHRKFLKPKKDRKDVIAEDSYGGGLSDQERAMHVKGIAGRKRG